MDTIWTPRKEALRLRLRITLLAGVLMSGRVYPPRRADTMGSTMYTVPGVSRTLSAAADLRPAVNPRSGGPCAGLSSAPSGGQPLGPRQAGEPKSEFYLKPDCPNAGAPVPPAGGLIAGICDVRCGENFGGLFRTPQRASLPSPSQRCPDLTLPISPEPTVRPIVRRPEIAVRCRADSV